MTALPSTSTPPRQATGSERRRESATPVTAAQFEAGAAQMVKYARGVSEAQGLRHFSAQWSQVLAGTAGVQHELHISGGKREAVRTFAAEEIANIPALRGTANRNRIRAMIRELCVGARD